MAAEQPPLPADVTPEQFFEQLMPMGFAAQAGAAGTTPGDFTIQFHLTGEGGGDWHAAIQNGDDEGAARHAGCEPDRVARRRRLARRGAGAQRRHARR